MEHSRRESRCRALSFITAGAAALLIWPVDAQQQPDAGLELSPALVRQLEALMAEKAQRTPAQQKVSSHLLTAERIRRGEPIAGGVVLGQSAVEVGPGGMVTVDVRADVTPEVLVRIDALGGSVINSVPKYRAIRARLPLAAVETLTELDAIQWIRPADKAVTHGQARAVQTVARAVADVAVTRKVNTSEGDIAHRADRARRQYGVDGTGIGIGVLSDGVDTLAQRQASGDLPATVTVLPGQARPAGADDTVTYDEGTAMLEIVHDLAPGADLFFATALGGQAQFATNIEALCDAGADVIVDDIGYFAEAVFQDDVVAQGVNAAVAKGCAYFSAAGNSGNLNDGTSGVWEGDFDAAGTFTIGGRVVGISHQYNARGANANRITDYDFNPICLKWSDPLGASANDYDLYLVDPDRAVLYTSVSSTDTQNGSQDPVECIRRVVDAATDETVDLDRYRLVVVKFSGSARYLHLNTNRGELSFSTAGQTYGHSAAANAIGVAATDARAARGPGGVFNGTESVRKFSSDGPRRIFFHPNGRAITPGNFSSTGGWVLQKPDVTAADGVMTATPEFENFRGTSAAAPHAAAIAALMLQAAGGSRSLTRAQLLQAMQDTALDIEARGDWDRDSGAGIVDALAAVGASDDGGNRAPSATGSVPAQTLTVGGGSASVNVAPYFTDPDGDALTYTAVSNRPGIVAAVVAGSTVTLTPVAAGTATVTVTARDSAGLSATQSITVTVSPASGVGGFTDDPLVAGVTLARAVHFLELRVRIDALRARAGLPAFAWTDRALTPGITPVRRLHLAELRTALAAAYAAAGRRAPVYADARVTAGTTPIRARHVTELRAAVVALEAGSGGNRAPRANGSIPAQTLTVGGGSATVDVAPYFTDPDGDRLTYTASSNRPTVVRASASGSTVTLGPVAAGTATVTVTARDPGGLSATQSIAVTVGTSGPALVGEITECSETAGTLFIDVVIAGTVTARRTVSRLLTPIRGYADGTYVGFRFLPAMSAGQTEDFRITGFILNAGQSPIKCTIEIG